MRNDWRNGHHSQQRSATWRQQQCRSLMCDRHSGKSTFLLVSNENENSARFILCVGDDSPQTKSLFRMHQRRTQVAMCNDRQTCGINNCQLRHRRSLHDEQRRNWQPRQSFRPCVTPDFNFFLTSMCFYNLFWLKQKANCMGCVKWLERIWAH